ncbi:MAG: hypothetical protein GY737_13865 [Desulfobacteraceae bacterium]|nr:hypothetical protein [Desulfobacteraceae bacterium]
MTDYLIQKGTGRVYVKTDAYMDRGDMLPYEPEVALGGLPPGKIGAVPGEAPAPPLPVSELDAMDKDQLEEYALKRFGRGLNKRKSPPNLVKEILELEEARG